jgi:type IV secretion system protein VirD4
MKRRTVATFLIFVIPWFIVCYILALVIPAFVNSNDWRTRIDLLESSFDKLYPLTLYPATYVAIGVFTFGYILAVYGIRFSKKDYRLGREYGDARWGNIDHINHAIGVRHPKLLRFLSRFSVLNKDEKLTRQLRERILLSKHLSINLDTWRHGRNCNVVVVGGAGAGKTRGYVKPNLLQGNTSFVVLDPAGEILRDNGYSLESMGYKIRVIDLTDMEKSDKYNPFVYIRSDNDVMTLITSLIKNTTPAGSSTSDPFWEKAETMLVSSLMLLLYHYGLPSERNFSMLMALLTEAKGDASRENILDTLFACYDSVYPGNIASLTYNRFKSGADKTMQSIIITASARLAKFDLESLQNLTMDDEMEFETYGDRKTALFIKTPVVDSSFNFMAGMVYTQLFQQLYSVADKEPSGHLKIPVHFLMDEFANVKLPEDFEKILSTSRKHWILISIILQNVAQLKAIYEKSWESIVGNCDTFIYLGGNEQSTHEYISKALGKETIRTKTYQMTRGGHGSSSVNFNQLGLELMSPDQVRRLDNRKCIVMVRGERPVMDDKYRLKSHPNIKTSADGGGHFYIHKMKEERL